MYTEKNTIALQQLFAGENIYLLKDEFITELPLEHTQTSIQTTTVPVISAQATPIYYQSQQKVMVILNNLNTADSELLEKILGAVKLDLSSVDIIELTKNKQIDLSQIFAQQSVNQIIVFGINLSELNLNMPLIPYQMLEKQGIKFIYSDSLSDIQHDIPKKKALWISLKEMF